MNYLAHLALAPDSGLARIGNLMGDFCKGDVPDTLPSEIAEGIRQHRRVDAVTDQHPVIRKAKSRFPHDLRRGSGIILDLACDHFLSCEWDRISGCALPLPDFIDQAHAELAGHWDLLPEPMQKRMHWMITRGLLASYLHENGIQQALTGLERRLSRPIGLTSGWTWLIGHKAQFRADFHVLWADLRCEFAHKSIATNT